MGFAMNLRLLRTMRKITQQDLAKCLDVPTAIITNWEVLGRQPSYESLAQLAEYFGVTVDFLVGKDTKEISNDTKGTIEPRENMRRNSESITLFSVTKSATKKETEKINDLLRSLKNSNEENVVNL